MKNNNLGVLFGLIGILLVAVLLLAVSLSFAKQKQPAEQAQPAHQPTTTIPADRSVPVQPDAIINHEALVAKVKPYLMQELTPEQWQKIELYAQRAAESAAVTEAVSQQITQPLSQEEMQEKFTALLRKVLPENTSQELARLYAAEASENGPMIVRPDYLRMELAKLQPDANVNLQRAREIEHLISRILLQNRNLRFQQEFRQRIEKEKLERQNKIGH